MHLIPYEGKDDWVEPTIFALHECLNRDEIPPAAEGCDYCAYVGAVNEAVTDRKR
mgnify:FL=1